ncbi:hypothetical protein DEO72_LG10g2497 [Vigna unguiculata]|uniref:Uncharacterized protein n=1 Tax=Vigna unguiculata TaxID=3917 RepID=A0A4D6NEW9_VIGUN|nr:hypothetical protein DEO72_LG10g2497 [Vigna unguiculata]
MSDCARVQEHVPCFILNKRNITAEVAAKCTEQKLIARPATAVHSRGETPIIGVKKKLMDTGEPLGINKESSHRQLHLSPASSSSSDLFSPSANAAPSLVFCRSVEVYSVAAVSLQRRDSRWLRQCSSSPAESIAKASSPARIATVVATWFRNADLLRVWLPLKARCSLFSLVFASQWKGSVVAVVSSQRHRFESLWSSFEGARGCCSGRRRGKSGFITADMVVHSQDGVAGVRVYRGFSWLARGSFSSRR